MHCMFRMLLLQHEHMHRLCGSLFAEEKNTNMNNVYSLQQYKIVLWTFKIKYKNKTIA